MSRDCRTMQQSQLYTYTDRYVLRSSCASAKRRRSIDAQSRNSAPVCDVAGQLHLCLRRHTRNPKRNWNRGASACSTVGTALLILLFLCCFRQKKANSYKAHPTCPHEQSRQLLYMRSILVRHVMHNASIDTVGVRTRNRCAACSTL